jgi:hypothetical protein
MASSSFLRKPMQNGVGARINRFGSQFSRGWPKQGEQFAGFAADILMVLSPWFTFGLPGVPRMRNRLIGTCLVLAPQGQPYPLCQQISLLNHRFFS